jgi:hypothetical protein
VKYWLYVITATAITGTATGTATGINAGVRQFRRVRTYAASGV